MALDPHHKREDLRLMELAIRKGWDIPEKVFQAWPSEIIAIVGNKNNPLRERLRAMELMMRLHGQNIGQAEVVQQTLVQINASKPLDAELAEQVRAMDATILPPHLLTAPPPANGNGHHGGNGHSSNGNGKPH